VKWILPAFLFISLATTATPADSNKEEQPKPAQSIPELQQQIEKILQNTHTPSVSVAIVRREGPEWITALGTADVATSRPATADTLFRIGSASKAFASLAILMLVDQGKLSLNDPVHKLVPEVWFENPWESTDPIRVVHLLEHTTGWDDMHFREYARDWPDNGSLLEGLDYDHTSRISRWRPGTRMSYCNSGPPVAAYIVEKLTGQRFEDFVAQNLFRPIGMNTATYFRPHAFQATTLYHPDGKTPYSYWGILLRPAGSINASAKDMAAYLQFYLNRGSANGRQILPSADIDRMEIPTSTWAAKDGMKFGYGLSNYWSLHDGFVYHGHDGGVEGGLTDVAYLPDSGVGYFYSINSGSDDAYSRIGKVIRNYLTHNFQRPPLPPGTALPSNAADYAGWYELDASRLQIARFLDRLAVLAHIQFKDGELLITYLGRWNDSFVPVAGTQFLHAPKEKGKHSDPVASLELLTPNPEGRFVEAGATLRKIPAWYAIGEILAVIYVILSVFAILLYAPIWILGGLIKRRRRPAERAMRIWPLLAVLSMLGTVVVISVSADDFIDRFGNLTGWSLALFLLTIAFAVASIAGAVSIWRAPTETVRPGVRRFSLAVTLALLVATAYLAYWGIIGLRTWA